nr:MAG TPA: hypothetical protein [Bacteriophage sp.]
MNTKKHKVFHFSLCLIANLSFLNTTFWGN